MNAGMGSPTAQVGHAQAREGKEKLNRLIYQFLRIILRLPVQIKYNHHAYSFIPGWQGLRTWPREESHHS